MPILEIKKCSLVIYLGIPHTVAQMGHFKTPRGVLTYIIIIFCYSENIIILKGVQVILYTIITEST